MKPMPKEMKAEMGVLVKGGAPKKMIAAEKREFAAKSKPVTKRSAPTSKGKAC